MQKSAAQSSNLYLATAAPASVISAPRPKDQLTSMNTHIPTTTTGPTPLLNYHLIPYQLSSQHSISQLTHPPPPKINPNHAFPSHNPRPPPPRPYLRSDNTTSPPPRVHAPHQTRRLHFRPLPRHPRSRRLGIRRLLQPWAAIDFYGGKGTGDSGVGSGVAGYVYWG